MPFQLVAFRDTFVSLVLCLSLSVSSFYQIIFFSRRENGICVKFMLKPMRIHTTPEYILLIFAETKSSYG